MATCRNHCNTYKRRSNLIRPIWIIWKKSLKHCKPHTYHLHLPSFFLFRNVHVALHCTHGRADESAWASTRSHSDWHVIKMNRFAFVSFSFPLLCFGPCIFFHSLSLSTCDTISGVCVHRINADAHGHIRLGMKWNGINRHWKSFWRLTKQRRTVITKCATISVC